MVRFTALGMSCLISENRINIVDSESICTTASKELYVLLWALQHVGSCQHLLTFFITITVAKKQLKTTLVWEKCIIEKGSVIKLSLWDNAVRALEQRTKLSLLNLLSFGMFSIKRFCVRFICITQEIKDLIHSTILDYLGG